MHKHLEYPKWKYHAEKPASLVHDKESEESLGHGWVDSPAHVAHDPVAKDESADESGEHHAPVKPAHKPKSRAKA